MRKINIYLRLSIVFIIILFLALATHLVDLWQIRNIREDTLYLIGEHQQYVSILNLNNSITPINHMLEQGVKDKKQTILKECSDLTLNFKKNLEDTIDVLSTDDLEREKHKDIINSFMAIKESLPENIEKIVELAELNDWLAVELRLRNQIKPFTERINENVNHIEDEVEKENDYYIYKAKDTENKAIGWIIMATCFMMFFAGIMGFLVTKSIVRPLKNLENATKFIAKGDFTFRAEIDGTDELSNLSKTFNQMAGELSGLYNTLEQKVAERTKELLDTQEKLIESEKLNTISQIIVSLSHEINNPMTVAMGNVMLIKSEKETISREELGDLLKITEEQLMRIVEVIEKLKKMERPKSKTYLNGMEMLDIK